VFDIAADIETVAIAEVVVVVVIAADIETAEVVVIAEVAEIEQSY
jgi:hypothetical protein